MLTFFIVLAQIMCVIIVIVLFWYFYSHLKYVDLWHMNHMNGSFSRILSVCSLILCKFFRLRL